MRPAAAPTVSSPAKLSETPAIYGGSGVAAHLRLRPGAGNSAAAAEGLERPRSAADVLRRDAKIQPLSAERFAAALPDEAWRDIAWREGMGRTLRSRFAAARMRPAHRDYWCSQPHDKECLLIEWPEGESPPTQYWLSTLPAHSAPCEARRDGQAPAGPSSATTSNSSKTRA